MRKEIVNKLLKVAWEAPWESFAAEPETYRLILDELVVREGQIPICDVCPFGGCLPPTLLPEGKVAVVHGVFIVSKKGGKQTSTDGTLTIASPFALCPACQAAMNIEHEDTVVPLARFKARWLKVMRIAGIKLGLPKAAYAAESHDFYLIATAAKRIGSWASLRPRFFAEREVKLRDLIFKQYVLSV